MRSRLARKIRKRPWRYSHGSIRQAWGFEYPGALRPDTKEWQAIDAGILDATMMRMTDEIIRQFYIPADVFRGDGNYSGLTATQEQWKGEK